MIPESVSRWLLDNGHGAVKKTQSVNGGCISNGRIIQTGSGRSFFLKTNSSGPADMFAREFEGLQALAVRDGPRVPQPYLFGEEFILMQDLQPSIRHKGYWTEFGRQLAGLHNHTNPRYGFEHDNYIGSTPQPNPWMEDGFAFFGEHRLRYQAQLAVRKGYLGQADAHRVDKLAERLTDLIPQQPASLLHGDLWSGNAETDWDGGPAIIDPAAHYGWAEAELAMTSLFGAFPDDFYQAYQEVRPLSVGFRQRFPLYNLYHLLNHLNLFGRGYLGQVQAILRRFR
jgi:protein-ribulosamine 3-kinase